MILEDTVQIKGPPEKVWIFIEDPERMKLWNPKIQRISAISWGERAVGYRYRITYTMRKKTSEFLAEIVEYRRPEKLVIRLTKVISRAAATPTRLTGCREPRKGRCWRKRSRSTTRESIFFSAC